MSLREFFDVLGMPAPDSDSGADPRSRLRAKAVRLAEKVRCCHAMLIRRRVKIERLRHIQQLSERRLRRSNIMHDEVRLRARLERAGELAGQHEIRYQDLLSRTARLKRNLAIIENMIRSHA